MSQGYVSQGYISQGKDSGIYSIDYTPRVHPGYPCDYTPRGYLSITLDYTLVYTQGLP